MRPYSKDLRLRVVQASANHAGSLRQWAARFRLRLSRVRDLLRRSRLTGDVTPKPHGGGYPAKLDATRLARVQAAVAPQPEATRQALCASLRTTAQRTVSLATMRRGLATLGAATPKKLCGLPRRHAQTSSHNAGTASPPSQCWRPPTWFVAMQQAATGPWPGPRPGRLGHPAGQSRQPCHSARGVGTRWLGRDEDGRRLDRGGCLCGLSPCSARPATAPRAGRP
jgi:transposase